MLAKRLDEQDLAENTRGKLVEFERLQRKLMVSLGRKPDVQPSASEIPVTLDLVHKAAEALDISERHAQAIEAWALKVAQESRNELADCQIQLSAYDDRLRAMEQLAKELQLSLSGSEQRAQRAEESSKELQEAAVRAEERASLAEDRAAKAEQRAAAAEAWLAHTDRVITDTLSAADRKLARLKPERDIVAELEGKLTRISAAPSQLSSVMGISRPKE
jgi:hypothetical protein